MIKGWIAGRSVVASMTLFFVLLSSACGKSDAERARYLNSLIEANPYKTKPPAANDESNEPRSYYGLAKRPNFYEFEWTMGSSQTREDSSDQVNYYWYIKGLHPSDPDESETVMAAFDNNNRLKILAFSDGKNTIFCDANKAMGTGD